MRVDKWLWAARFFKTRGLAADAADSGKIKINNVVAKPSKEVKVGDSLKIRAAQDFEFEVLGLNDQRRPAAEAQLLYRETEESIAARQRGKELNSLAPFSEIRGRPTKRNRRQIEQFRSGD